MQPGKHILQDIVRRHKSGEPLGIYSVCSAHPQVLQAAMIQSLSDESLVCIEATSNQVDQFGGYTGMTPPEFVDKVRSMARQASLPSERIILGGDHLGPNAWQGQPAAVAMERARELVAAYVAAGFTKIHLDASMRCADDPGSADEPLPDEIVGGRAADLCAVAERTCEESGDPVRPVYIIGTEVPSPGGVNDVEDVLRVTRPEDAERTVSITRKAFLDRGLEKAWERVIAVVVQPGVEFGDSSIHEYDRSRAVDLSRLIENDPNLVFEAHSTDYQTPSALTQLVEDHFAILKVGPWLTFVLREALFALESIECELLGHCRGGELSNLAGTLDQAMLDNPRYWDRYYHGEENQQRLARRYSFSDRCRYYWPDGKVTQAVGRLLENLTTHAPPLSLISQYLPKQYEAIRDGRISPGPRDLIQDKIREVLSVYAAACGLVTIGSQSPNNTDPRS